MLVVLTIVLGGCVWGCQPNIEPMERLGTTIMTEVVKPAVEKAASELTSQSASLHGAASVITPGYTGKGCLIMGTGAAWEFSVTADGITATVTGATMAAPKEGEK
jgi:hypothetical protein